MVLSNEKLLSLCEKYLIVHCKVLRDLLDFHPFSFVPFIRMTIEFVLHYLFQPEFQVLLFDSFVVQCLNLVKGIILCAEYKPAKVFEGKNSLRPILIFSVRLLITILLTRYQGACYTRCLPHQVGSILYRSRHFNGSSVD